MIRRLKGVSARTKILLFAFLFIILPSAILGYLGFRSIGNRALSLEESYRSMARLMRDELAAEVSTLEDRYVRDVRGQEWTQDPKAVRSLLGEVQARHPVVGESFIVGGDGFLVHPQFYLETGGGRLPSADGPPGARSALIERGERFEFAELDYPSAARSYEEAARRAASPEQRAYARLLLGRCYFKMRDYARAGEQFRALAEQSGEARGSDGTPLKIVGLYRLAETRAALGDGDGQVGALLDLFEELSLGPRGFESRQFYLESVRAEIERALETGAVGESDRARWNDLKREGETRAEKIRRLEAAQQALLSRSDLAFMAKAGQGHDADPVSAAHLTIRDEAGAPRRFGYLLLSSAASVPGRRLLAYEIDKAFLRTDLFPRRAGREGDRDSVRAALLSEAGPLTPLPDAASMIQALASESLDEVVPGWSLALFDSQGKSIGQIVRGEMRWYAAVLLGIAVLIVAGIVMTLRAATHEAETVRLRSEFVSNVSHELKTPLSLIRLFGETLDSERWTDDAKRREFSRIIARESRRLGHLIDNVLDFSKIDSGRKEYRFEKEDLVEVVTDTVESYRYYLRDQGFELDVSLLPGPVFAMIDKDAIAQALLNLLNNAEKFAGEGKYIGVKMVLEEGQVRIAVEDKGPGIPPSDLKRIFEKFYRGGHRPAREAQGCGLGLTIVKNTVESHGGSVNVESEVGRGSRFFITLPLGDQGDGPGGPSRDENGQDPDR
jgi:signal transduction histidine kinase